MGSIRLSIKSRLHAVGVPDDRIDDCLTWAFGEDFRTCNLSFWNERWNAEHNDIFNIAGTDNFLESIERVGRAFMKELRSGSDES